MTTHPYARLPLRTSKLASIRTTHGCAPILPSVSTSSRQPESSEREIFSACVGSCAAGSARSTHAQTVENRPNPSLVWIRHDCTHSPTRAG